MLRGGKTTFPCESQIYFQWACFFFQTDKLQCNFTLPLSVGAAPQNPRLNTKQIDNGLPILSPSLQISAHPYTSMDQEQGYHDCLRPSGGLNALWLRAREKWLGSGCWRGALDYRVLKLAIMTLTQLIAGPGV